jgi:hypothetical protein
MFAWQQAAATILQGLVSAQDPQAGASLVGSLVYLQQAIIAQSASVQVCALTSTVTANSGNSGAGSVWVGLTRGDGLSLQNTIAETGILVIASDSFTGGATLGQEPWQWQGAPNVSSLGTGAPVGAWDWDALQASGSALSGNCIAANQYAVQTGNLLTNGDFALWPVALADPTNWHLVTGAWGTDAQRSTTVLGGVFSVEFLPTATLTTLTQQFGTASTTTGATAGTTATLAPYTGYAENLWLKAAGVITGGVLSVSLVNSSGAVINDQQGNPNTTTIALTGASTNWVPHSLPFRLPINPPSVVRLQIEMSTALAGAGLILDWVAMCEPPTAIYPAGPNLAVFSSPASPFVAVPNPDGWTVALTNDRGGSTFGATWQTLLNRLFGNPNFIAATSGSPTIADTLITGA